MQCEADSSLSDRAVVSAMDDWHGRCCVAQRHLLSFVAEADRRALWKTDGARDMAHWLWMRYGLSDWNARRWIVAAHALEGLPRVAAALESGRLGIDKAVELCRFASPESEADLVPWAERVSAGAIRRRGDLALEQTRAEVRDQERERSVVWWFEDGGRRFGLEASLPPAAGAVVASALDRLAEQVPAMPGEEGGGGVEARRADALMALCSARIAQDPNPDRATVVVHADLETLRSGRGGCAVEGGGTVPVQTVERLLCTARVQAAVEDPAGELIQLGRLRRDPPAWMMRQLRHRDLECRFPGCGARRFVHAHHIEWWERGGTTELRNLVLLCGFHHRLVHELGWRLRRERDGTVVWLRPDGRRYCAGPAPPSAEDPPRSGGKDKVVEADPGVVRSGV